MRYLAILIAFLASPLTAAEVNLYCLHDTLPASAEFKVSAEKMLMEVKIYAILDEEHNRTIDAPIVGFADNWLIAQTSPYSNGRQTSFMYNKEEMHIKQIEIYFEPDLKSVENSTWSCVER